MIRAAACRAAGVQLAPAMRDNGNVAQLFALTVLDLKWAPTSCSGCPFSYIVKVEMTRSYLKQRFDCLFGALQPVVN